MRDEVGSLDKQQTNWQMSQNYSQQPLQREDPYFTYHSNTFSQSVLGQKVPDLLQNGGAHQAGQGRDLCLPKGRGPCCTRSCFHTRHKLNLTHRQQDAAASRSSLIRVGTSHGRRRHGEPRRAGRSDAQDQGQRQRAERSLLSQNKNSCGE